LNLVLLCARSCGAGAELKPGQADPTRPGDPVARDPIPALGWGSCSAYKRPKEAVER